MKNFIFHSSNLTLKLYLNSNQKVSDGKSKFGEETAKLFELTSEAKTTLDFANLVPTSSFTQTACTSF